MQRTLPMIVNDSHIHIGQFNEHYFSPKVICDFLDSVAVDKFAISSTSICGGDIEKSLDDIREVLIIAKERAFPVLWLIPALFDNEIVLKYLIDSGISWKCVKMHGFHNWTAEYIDKAVAVAQQLHTPFLMHTGGRPWCEAGQYLSLCRKYPQQIFILAHSRPCDETISVMKCCPNAWADTAFTPLDDIVTMVNAGLEDRILWGSDYPIPHLFYKRQNIRKIYIDKMKSLLNLIGAGTFNKITRTNFNLIL